MPPQRRTSNKNRAARTVSRKVIRNWAAHLNVDSAALDTATKFRNLASDKRVLESARIISDIVIEARKDPDSRFSLAIDESQTLLPGYATLDIAHRLQIKALIEEISDYLRDSTRKRPLNALMLAAPGAGKSHFIKQLAAAMREESVQAVTFNMATMESTDDMAQPIDELRNLKVNDRFPLLFLDEFDSDTNRYASLLPLLWDGELHVGQPPVNHNGFNSVNHRTAARRPVLVVAWPGGRQGRSARSGRGGRRCRAVAERSA